MRVKGNLPTGEKMVKTTTQILRKNRVTADPQSWERFLWVVDCFMSVGFRESKCKDKNN